MRTTCPECGGLVAYNSYFAAYICQVCGWRDDTPGIERRLRYELMTGGASGKEIRQILDKAMQSLKGKEKIAVSR